MIRTISLAAALAMAATTFAYADDDDDDKGNLPAGVVETIEEVMSLLNCSGYEEVEVEDNGQIEIEDAKCKAGTMDIKLDKNGKVLVMSAG